MMELSGDAYGGERGKEEKMGEKGKEERTTQGRRRRRRKRRSTLVLSGERRLLCPPMIISSGHSRHHATKLSKLIDGGRTAMDATLVHFQRDVEEAIMQAGTPLS